MATAPREPGPKVANVDFLIDENGSRVDVPDNSTLKVAGEHEATVGATGPTNWWLYGLIGLAIIIALLFLMQMFTGAPGTDVQPGSPVAEPVVEPVAPAEPAASVAPTVPADTVAPAQPAAPADAVAPATPAAPAN